MPNIVTTKVVGRRVKSIKYQRIKLEKKLRKNADKILYYLNL